MAQLVCKAAKIKHEDGREMMMSDFMHTPKQEEEEPTVDEAINGVMAVLKVKANGQ